ncbi:cysteine--tRNA ligase [Phyllobacterium sp. 0TCS1.6C]|uniref:cysteine--tRNA ligase n=1 Tax=unclassified Phyllobacterium TaxID=2638441 RepID=UPI0022650A3C|nr:MULTISPECIES: cysteine--tRNA ligase [unclassified Phyllobacterium]MCX8280519.1 cysteine--tRNA ligase [Phyllobacterium sp. 0TCS1.6C]MCX8295032.1 cysteine--tRNA ligase [Phyllobacterium sp. 0TCS1.6A]
MSQPLSLYNTLTRSTEVFEPVDARNVRMYVCGPTVYDYAHIGNARPVIVFDVLFRLLCHLYGESNVTYVRNITDVDDKINARAASEYPDLPLNEAIRRVTEITDAQFQADVAALGNLPPTQQPRATEHIAEMTALIDRLVERGIAYVADGHVLFSPSAMNAARGPRYGLLSRRSSEDLLAGARVDVASYKRDEMDFVLWKPSSDEEPGWPSPAGIEGRGRPGWHIECSAMALAKLLVPFGGGLQCDDPQKNVFDIHGGGIDLVFPHHENEIAQTCCALGTQRMANVWMHNGFLQVEGQKMSKSLGNFVTIHELLATETFGGRRWPGEVLRLAMLMTNYREPIDFSLKRLEEAENILAKAREYAGSATPGAVPEAAIDYLRDDLATPGLINWLAVARKSRELDPGAYRAAFALIGVDLGETAAISDDLHAEVEAKVQQRLQLLGARDFAAADALRDELAAKGIQLKDGKDPATGARVTSWEVKR